MGKIKIRSIHYDTEQAVKHRKSRGYRASTTLC